MIILLLSFILSLSTSLACDFSPKVKTFYSFSGPVTLLLQDLNLLSKPQLKGISHFHPVAPGAFKGQVFPGGVFLSHDAIKGLNGSVVFFDESRDLGRVFARYPDIKVIEIKTRNLTPKEAQLQVLDQLKPWLQGCDTSKLDADLDRRLNQLRKMIPAKTFMVFYLGLIQQKTPQMLMVNDGIVKWLVNEKLIQTYPSDLAYVNWSAKVMGELPATHVKVGLRDSAQELTKKVERQKNTINLTFPGALIPGRGQVDAFIYLFKNL